MNIVQPVTAVATRLQYDLGDILDGVAGVAVEPAMRSRQRILRLAVVIETPARPPIGIVTTCAIGAQPALVVVVLVAASTDNPRVLERRRAMTFLAGYNRMPADQREPGQVVIECGRSAPTGVAVASLAAAAQLPFMRVVLLVARHAAGRELVVEEVAGVTRFALGLRVSAFQRKLRPVVIEPNGPPPGLIVTGLAFWAISAGVNVLYAVTLDACSGQICVPLAGMTIRAGNAPVRALKRKPRGTVIERLYAPPRVLAVAAVAFLAEPTLVLIGPPVTVHASRRRTTKLRRAHMTLVASRRPVRALQLEVRERVVEGLPVELDDVGVSPFVIGVAVPAILFRRIGLTSVQSPAGQPIPRDLLMAGQAQIALGLSRERHVALEAALLQLDVAFDERSRHDEFLGRQASVSADSAIQMPRQ
jgi:hypothetical protein